jgi:hypothetical protein
LDVATSHTTEELCCFGYNHDLSRSLLGCWRAPKIATTSVSRALSHHRTLWEQAEGRLDVTTSHNRGTLLLWLQSRPFTLVARRATETEDHIDEWIKGVILSVNIMQARGRNIGRHYQPQQRNLKSRPILSLLDETKKVFCLQNINWTFYRPRGR